MINRPRRHHSRGDADDLFFSALERAPGARGQFLDEACGGDGPLREEIESLLSAHQEADRFLQNPILSDNGDADANALIGERVGAYLIESIIASGGMGTVYRATRADGLYEQHVAIKVISGRIATAGLRRRFELERQTLARLSHPYIARLLDGGATRDRLPYLVMELVEGLPIDRYCRQADLTITARLEFFLKVCEAVQCAHRHLVVHRDLKPGNILVTHDGTPKLLDFGISKILDEDTSAGGDRTMTMLRAMTPHYASPEQIRRKPITTTSDVYSLGVVLYELLVGRRPYHLDGRSDWERARVVCQEDPPTPSTAVSRPSTCEGDTDCLARDDGPKVADSARRGLAKAMRGDLDNIVMKALSKDPVRRYASVEQFAEDIRLNLEGRPVLARRDSVRYRASKWITRHRGVFVASTALVVALMLGTIGTTVGLLRARRAAEQSLVQRNAAIEARDQAQQATRFLQKTILSTNPFRQGRPITVLELLEEADRRIETELGDEPVVEAEIRYAIGSTYAGMWMWEDAISHLETALRIYRATKGTDAPEVADCLSVLGRGLTFHRDPRSVGVQREGLAIRLALFGPDHPLVAESKGNLGYALWHGPKRWEEAERCYLDALRIYRAAGDYRHRDYARFTFSIGVMYAIQGRVVESEARYREALDIYRELSGSEDRYMVECLTRYAVLLDSLDRHDEATRLREEAEARTPPGMPIRDVATP